MKKGFWLALIAACTLGILAFLASCGGGSEIRSVADLQGKVVGAQKGSTSADYARERTPANRVREFPTIDEAFDALEREEIDAVINDFPSSMDAVKTRQNLEIGATIETGEVYGLVLPEGSPLAAKVDAALAAIKQDGTYEAIFRKWFGKDPPARILSSQARPLEKSLRPGTVKTRGGKDTLLVAAEIPYAPFVFGAKPNYEGFDIEIVRAIARNLGLEFRVVDVPFERIFEGIAAGRYDLGAAAATITRDRETRVDFSEPYFPADQSLVVKR